jgi:hypothetical protein
VISARTKGCPSPLSSGYGDNLFVNECVVLAVADRTGDKQRVGRRPQRKIVAIELVVDRATADETGVANFLVRFKFPSRSMMPANLSRQAWARSSRVAEAEAGEAG